jgi:hypothetical protein
LRKTWSSRHRRLRTPDRKRIEHPHIIVKTLKIQNKERILKVAREKCQVRWPPLNSVAYTFLCRVKSL